MQFTFPAIGVLHSCFNEKFGIPRQPGLAPHARARLELLPPFNDPATLEGLENCSHLWIQFVFHANNSVAWTAKVRPPRLGGNKKLGVFATRSPIRPAPIGLSVVKLERIVSEPGFCGLELSGVDILDGTPVLDIKPYVPYVDRVEAAVNSFAAEPPRLIKVIFDDKVNTAVDRDFIALVEEVLQQDPRPAYQQQSLGRVYGMTLSKRNIRFQVICQDGDSIIQVIDINDVNINHGN